jgi:hypothetical protein
VKSFFAATVKVTALYLLFVPTVTFLIYATEWWSSGERPTVHVAEPIVVIVGLGTLYLCFLFKAFFVRSGNKTKID